MGGNTPRRELEVEAVWHQQVHAARVSTLTFSADGGALWTGFDAAAPRLGPQAEGDEAPLLLISCEDGSTLGRAAGMPTTNLRLLRTLPEEGTLLCATGDGALLKLGVTQLDGTAAALSGATALPGTPAAAAAASAAIATPAAEEPKQQGAVQGPSTPPRPPAAALEEAAGQGNGGDSSSSSMAGPEFIAESGYRGPREGYLFREGAKGSGYYRKDVVRQYCTVLPQKGDKQAPPAVTAGTAAKAAAAAASRQTREVPASDGVSTDEQHTMQEQAAAEEARQYIQRLVRAPPNMQSVALSPCGTLLFTSSLGSKDSSARVWRLRLHPQGAAPQTAAGSRSSGSGGAGSADATDSSAPSEHAAQAALPQPELYRTLSGHAAAVLSLAVSPDGRLLFTGSYDQTVRVWRTADWHCVRVLKGHGGGVRSLVVSPDQRTLYSAAADNTIRAWSLEHWVCLRTLHGRHDDTTWPACLALSPDGSLLASGSTGPFGASTLKVFQTGSGGGREAGACLATFAQLKFDQKAGMTALLFSSDGGTLYSGASDGTLAAWRLSWREKAGGGSGGGLRRGFL